MKIKIATVCLLLFATACTSKQTQTKAPVDTLNKKSATVQYTCTMHPGVLSNKPGTCPKCGMDLVEKDNSK